MKTALVLVFFCAGVLAGESHFPVVSKWKQISWNAVPLEKGYKVYRNGLAITSTSQTACALPVRSGDVIFITATNGSTESQPSASVTIR